MTQTVRISATVEMELYKEINKMAIQQKRSLSQMVDFLLSEAVAARQAHKQPPAPAQEDAPRRS